MNTPEISVIIVTYNSSKYIEKCLASLFVSLEGIKSEVIIVDNASTDDTVKVLQKFKKRITLIASKENKGFGKAMNLGYTKTKGEYIWLVNPDAFVGVKCALEILKVMKKNEDVGVVGTQMRYENGSLQGSFGYRPTFLRELLQMALLYHYFPVGRVVLPSSQTASLFNKSHEVAWVSGGCMMIRRDALGKSKTIFDPAYFMYLEDIDTCLRISKNGYRIWYLASAYAKHVHSASFGSGKGRFMYSNILEAHSVLQFWMNWYPQHITQRTLLRFLLKIKLAIKLVLSIKGIPEDQRARYWQQWRSL